MEKDHFQLSPANVEERFQRLERRRQRNPDADDPLFRPIDADDFRTNGESASDFSNLRENGLVRITFPLPSNIKLVDPATGAPSDRDVRGRVAERSDGQRRGPHGTGRCQSVATRAEPVRWIPVGRPRDDASRAGARCAHQPRADPERAAATASRRPGLVSAGAVHEPSCSRPVRRRPGGHDAVAGSGSAAQRARGAGQGRVRARLYPMPRWPRTVDSPGPGGSISRHLRASVRVPSTP